MDEWKTIVHETIAGGVGVVLGLLVAALSKVSRKDFNEALKAINNRLEHIEAKAETAVTRAELKGELAELKQTVGDRFTELRGLVQDVLRMQRG